MLRLSAPNKAVVHNLEDRSFTTPLDAFLSSISCLSIRILSIPIVFLVVLVAALGEELGWMGFVFGPLQERFGALKAATLLGAAWALIHIPLFSASTAMSTRWITWQCVYIGMTRILFVWVYSNSGKSLSAVTLMHATFNIGWMVFPPSGDGLLVPSFYDPVSLALTATALVAAVTFLWGPATLAQFRCEFGAPRRRRRAAEAPPRLPSRRTRS
jgi:hypothetical protein